MKIQLDYDSQTVTVDDTVDLGKLFDTLEKILPKWKKWKLKTNTTIVTTTPTIYYPQPYYHEPWWKQQTITYGTSEESSGRTVDSSTFFTKAAHDAGESNFTLENGPESGTFCLDINGH